MTYYAAACVYNEFVENRKRLGDIISILTDPNKSATEKKLTESDLNFLIRIGNQYCKLMDEKMATEVE